MNTTPTLNPDNVARIVMLTYGRMENGTDAYWCYVAVKPSEYDRFMTVLKGGKLNLHTFDEDGFGEVVVSGPGMYPPIDVTKQVAKAYNAPITDIFNGADPKSAIARKIDELKKQSDTQS